LRKISRVSRPLANHNFIVNIHTSSNDLNPLSEKLGVNFATPGSPPVWGPNANVIPAVMPRRIPAVMPRRIPTVMPRRIPLPPPEDLPASVSDLENGTPASFTKQI
jgi:hypothetical protein